MILATTDLVENENGIHRRINAKAVMDGDYEALLTAYTAYDDCINCCR